VLTASLPNRDLMLLIWIVEVGLAAYACVKMHLGVREKMQLQIQSERSAEARASRSPT